MFISCPFAYILNSLFDMDGTLVNSLAGVTAAWEVFKRDYPDKALNVTEILSRGSYFMFRATFSAYNLVAHRNSWYPDSG